MDRSAPHSAGERVLRSIFLDGPAGRLEALLESLLETRQEALLDMGLAAPDPAQAQYAAVIAHPHPLGGGSMHNKVVYHAARVFRELGWPTLRFNFRGVGLSEGKHDGVAEADDVKAALDWMAAEFRMPILAAGFSFGAAMMLSATVARADVHGLIALGLPLHSSNQRYSYPPLAHWQIPTLFLSGSHDIYASREELATSVAPAATHAQLRILPDADHFFTGQLSSMQQAIRQWLMERGMYRAAAVVQR